MGRKSDTIARPTAAIRGFDLEALVAAAPMAILVTDRRMRIVRASPRWREERGVKGRIVGRPMATFIHGDVALRQLIFDRALTGESMNFDKVELTLASGGKRWVRLDVNPWRDATGQIGGVMYTSVDITDMVEALEKSARAEHRLKTTMRLAECNSWEIDYKVGRMETDVTGEASPGNTDVSDDELIGDIWKAIHPDDRKRVQAEFADAMLTGRPFKTEYRFPSNDDQEVWIFTASETRLDKKGQPAGVTGIWRNITEKKKDEIEFRKAKEAAEAASQAKSAFLANMSHEIRTPLNGVLGVASALSGMRLTRQQHEMVGLIETSAKTLEALLGDILDLSRLEAGDIAVEAQPFDLETAVSACTALFGEAARGKGLELTVEVAPDAQGSYLGDAARIRQVLSNLLSNALKFTDRGSIKLAVAPENGRLAFTVTDTGIGFDAEAKARLFERFVQVDGSLTRRYGGTGLGLALSRAVADAMGGELTGEGEPGVGATFTFSVALPACEAPLAPAAPAHDEAEEGVCGPETLRVLLAEDHPTNRRVVELILSAVGVDLTMVENGAEAVDAAKAGHFHLILMDMQMPVMDGLTAIRQIRGREAIEGLTPVPIYTVSANALPEHARAAVEAGAWDHITKPVTAESLLAACETAWLAAATPSGAVVH